MHKRLLAIWMHTTFKLSLTNVAVVFIRQQPDLNVNGGWPPPSPKVGTAARGVGYGGGGACQASSTDLSTFCCDLIVGTGV